MIIITGSITAKPEHVDEVRELSLAHVRRSRLEPGCLSHAVHIDVENPLRFVFFETWADQAAVDAHFSMPASREFAGAASRLASVRTDIQIYEATQTR
jgi:quinol monooxygenase YgiN